MSAEVVGLITDDTDAVVVADSLVITDARGARLILARVEGRYRLIARTGVDLGPGNVTALVEFFDARIVTEEEVTRRLAQQHYYDLLTERAQRTTDVLERAVHERVDEPAAEGSALFDARVLLGLDGGTGGRDIHAEADRG